MKIKIVFAFLLIITVCNAQIDNGVITYKKYYARKIFTDKNNPNYERFSEIEKKEIEALKEIEFILNFTPQESSFQYVKTLKTENDKIFKLALSSDRRSIYYANAFENIYITKREAFGEEFLIQKDDFKWQLLNETKQIGNYICYKAITIIKRYSKGEEKEFVKTAWYCPQINIPFGPVAYGGLPGLILELVDGVEVYTAVKIELNSPNFTPVKALTKGRKISEMEMSKLYSQAMGEFKKNGGF